MSGKTPPRTILEYFCGLPPELLSKLYEETFTALTIYRSLPQLAKQYVMRALWMPPGQPVPRQSGLDSWVKLDPLVVPTEDHSPAAHSTNRAVRVAHHQSLRQLFELRIFTNRPIESRLQSSKSLQGGVVDTQEVVLDPNFQACLRRALCYDVPKLQDDSLGPDKNAPTLEQLRQEADKRWEQVLYFIVNESKTELFEVTEDVKQQLLQMKLLEHRVVKIRVNGDDESDDDDEPAQQDVAYFITPLGYKFLFKSQHAQVWDLILHYLEPQSLKRKNLLRHEVLQFLFKLSFMRVGQDYSKEDHALTPSQQEVVRNLASFGLIYVRAQKGRRFYPTHLALNLSSTTAPQATLHHKGFIIVETSFKLYAFTTSRLQLALLKMFCHVTYELPNMIAGIMTKATIRRAFKKNISAEEIINYLEQHAHPQCRAADGSPAIEPTVKDQIRLWESERHRLISNKNTFMCDQFSPTQFVEIKKWFSKYPDELVWTDSINRILVLTAKGKEILKEALQATRKADT
eukprot:gb/GEZN01005419.1/.p1 GENE.gb/GEZN01005419.1/~~gb/GEZN01005419.1/.p1  ORF type:complete len:516 (+),score=82.08 gb/GEZN01005419.1/:180-1727(+)